MKISRKTKAIYAARKREKKPDAPASPDFGHRKLAWSPIRTKDELHRVYTRLVPEIRRIAYHAGYGIGVHGSMRRDLDLIAVPWTEEAVSAHELAQRIQLSLCGMKEASYDWEQKPHGRKGCTIVVGMNAFIDLSVSPFLQVEGKDTRKAE